jgi:hypothetical protein
MASSYVPSKYQSLLTTPYWSEPYVIIGALVGVIGLMLVIYLEVSRRRNRIPTPIEDETQVQLIGNRRERLISIGAILALFGFAVPFVTHLILNSGYTLYVYEKIERNVSQKYEVVDVSIEEVQGIEMKEALQAPRKVLVDESTGNYVAIAKVQVFQNGSVEEYRYDVEVDPTSGDPLLTPITDGAPTLMPKREAEAVFGLK